MMQLRFRYVLSEGHVGQGLVPSQLLSSRIGTTITLGSTRAPFTGYSTPTNAFSQPQK